MRPQSNVMPRCRPMKEPMMSRRLSDRLASFAMAFVVTFGLAGGIHSLAAHEAATAAAEMAHSGGLPSCSAKV